MKVKRNTLLLFACLVWNAAGFNILRIGLISYPPYRSVLNFLLSILVFAVFQKFIFGKLVKKHTTRIRSYKEERHFFLKFFDGKAFAIMAVMMSGGIGLRVSGLAPERLLPSFIPAWAPLFCWPDYYLAVTLEKLCWSMPKFKIKWIIKENKLCKQS